MILFVSFLKLINRFLGFLRRVLNLAWKFVYYLDIMNEAFWLSILSEKCFMKFIRFHYQKGVRYSTCEWNAKGFFDWEQELFYIVESKVNNAKVVVIGAGGGREVFALNAKGVCAEGYEADDRMVKFANDFSRKENLNLFFKTIEYNCVPKTKCDVLWFGWGMYTHIFGRDKRVRILKEAKNNLDEYGLIVISYWNGENKRDWLEKLHRLSKKVGFRKVERGESFRNALWGKYYYKEQIREEALLAGLEVMFISEEGYGRAILRKNAL